MFKIQDKKLREDIQVGLKELDEGKGEPWDVVALKNELCNQLDKAA